MNDQLATIDQAKGTLLDLAVRFGPKLLVAILILIAGFIVSRWVARWFARALARIELEPPVRILLMRVVRLLVLMLFVIMALQNMGVELLPLLAGLSVAGAAIALATQGVLSNVAAGLTIIFTKPFRVGQYVQIVGVEGQVESITLFSTTLSHTDRSMIVIPNRKVVGEILHNYGRIRQLDVAVGVAYDTDLNSALGAIQEILRNNPRVLKDPAPFIQTTQLGNSAVVVAVKPWVSVADFGDATGEINKAIVETFRGRGIVIPYPQHEVRLLGQSSS
jgi:small conductance mechanosensitive channel